MLEKIKQIKYSRLSEEEKFFLETIDGIEPFISNEFPQSVFWLKDKNKFPQSVSWLADNIVLFEQDFKNECLFVDYKEIWSVIKNKYGHENYNELQTLLMYIIKKHSDLMTSALIKSNNNLIGIHEDTLNNRFTDLIPLNL